MYKSVYIHLENAMRTSIHAYMRTYDSFQKCVAFLWEISLQGTQQSLWKSMSEYGIV